MQEISPNVVENTVTDEVVKSFLLNDPHFFERNADLLANIHLPSPHGKGAISLTERQQLAQRDKIRATEAIMAELIEYGKENEATSEKLHRLTLALIENPNLASLANILDSHIKATFALDLIQLNLWDFEVDNTINLPYFTPTPQQFKNWALTLSEPYCGKKNPAIDCLADELQMDTSLQSFAILPIHDIATSRPVIGALILATERNGQFQSEAGLVYLTRMSELLSATLASIRNA